MTKGEWRRAQAIGGRGQATADELEWLIKLLASERNRCLRLAERLDTLLDDIEEDHNPHIPPGPLQIWQNP